MAHEDFLDDEIIDIMVLAQDSKLNNDGVSIQGRYNAVSALQKIPVNEVIVLNGHEMQILLENVNVPPQESIKDKPSVLVNTLVEVALKNRVQFEK